MNERDERERNTPPGESREDPREEKLQSLFTAAYLPLDPSEALVRRVAAVVAEREAQEVRRRWWSLPFGWGSAVSAVAAAALLIALGWTLLRGHHGRARQLSPPSVALSPRLPRNPPGPRPLPHAPRHDQAPLIASLPPVPKGPAVAVPHPPQSVPIHGAQPTTGKRSPLHPRQPQPAVSGPPAPAGDDMAFVNPVPETIIRGWAPMPVSDWERIEARVRRNVRVKEDFVRIPFPRIASTSTRQIVAAVEQYKREAAIVDPRLSREVTLAVKGTALSDVCDQLQ
ncbi:MAG TPA: hypothetical protein VFO24_04200, partial [Usitatibacter sp.]|nr:hypothetical protein [Usitatibacter sp.]